MLKKNNWKLIGLAFAQLVLFSCGSNTKAKLAYVGGEQIAVNDQGGFDTTYHEIPEFEFVNQDSIVIGSKDYDGSIYVADFFFTTCPTICKDMSGNLIELQKILSIHPEVKILSHTVNPDYDTPSVLKEYAKSIGANTNSWNFVTGEKEKIYRQGVYGYFLSAQEAALEPGGFLHSEFFVLVDKNRHIRSRYDENGNVKGVYDGTNPEEVKMLINDIKILLKEK